MINKINKVFLTLVLAFALFCLCNLSLGAQTADAYLITTNPGEDSSTTVNVAWHSEIEGTFVSYGKSGDSQTSDVAGECTPFAYTEDDGTVISDYKCVATLDNLEPDTKYVYKVGRDVMSAEYKFQTAGQQAFSFAFFTDIHVYNKLPNRLDTAKKTLDNIIASSPDLKLIVTGGDICAYGTVRSYFDSLFTWKGATDYIWAATPGNHDYYNTSASAKGDQYWGQYFNNPANGAAGTGNTTYYFKYNNVLFISLNSEDTAESATLAQNQKEWLDEVLSNNDATFKVVYCHRGFYNGSGGNTSNARMMINNYQSILDKHGVDLVLAGHDHIYARTRNVYNDAAGVDGVGTIYINNAQIGDRTNTIGNYSPLILKASDLQTAIKVSVGATSMSIVAITPDNEVVDRSSIISKSTIINNDAFIRRMSITADSDDFSKMSLNLNDHLFARATLLEVIDEQGQKVISLKPTTTAKEYSIPDVSKYDINKEYTVNIYLRDGNTITKQFNLTNKQMDYGTINEPKIENNQLVWQATLKGDVVTNFKIYINDQLVDTLPPTSRSYSLAEIDKYTTNKIKLVAVTQDDYALCSYEANYGEKLILDIKDVNEIFAGETKALDITTNIEFKGQLIFDIADPTIATVNEKNEVVALLPGETKVTVTSNDAKSLNIVFSVVVTAKPTVKFTNSKLEFYVGDEVKLMTIASENYTVKYTTDFKGAQISDDLVKLNEAGTFDVVASLNEMPDVVDVITFTIKEKPTITFKNTVLDWLVGDEVELNAEVSEQNFTVTYTSTSSDVTISTNKIRFNKSGTFEIVASLSEMPEVTATITFTVTEVEIIPPIEKGCKSKEYISVVMLLALGLIVIRRRKTNI